MSENFSDKKTNSFSDSLRDYYWHIIENSKDGRFGEKPAVPPEKGMEWSA
jgi:hypothetical protein